MEDDPSAEKANARDELSRDAVVAQLHKISYSGATGTVAFDANGDTTHAGFSLYTINGTKWGPKELLTADATGKVTVAG